MLFLSYTLSISLMIIVPLILAAWLRRVARPVWLLFSLGSLTFILSQVIHLPLNEWLANIGFLPKESSSELPIWRTAITLGLTAGLSEELVRAAGYAVIRRWKPSWMNFQDSFMLGLGHGGIESMIFGAVLSAAKISSLLPLTKVDLNTLGLTLEQLATLRLQLDLFTGSPLNAFFPLIERVLAISIHVVFSLMVWRSFVGNRFSRDWYYIPLAILYHAGIDAVFVWITQTTPSNYPLRLLVFGFLLVPGVLWTLRILRNTKKVNEHNQREFTPEFEQSSLKADLGVFWVAVAKELRQLWRTKRLLVVGAVFLVFGMGSPLIAKFTPLAFSSIGGMEVIAELIPEPTAGDAMAQYTKNLSQFGFLLAVIMAMGLVVGEKERGVAAMILSKPMPRWAFVSSKLTSQALMYLGGFILAGIGAYAYTIFLFGSITLGDFVLLNGLMFLWLLVFVALSLLGSTIAGSTVAAGGIGLGLSVVMLLLGVIPRYGVLLPSGLMSWANQLGQRAAGVAATLPGSAPVGAEMFANYAALTSALVLILMSLVLAIGVFELQEL